VWLSLMIVARDKLDRRELSKTRSSRGSGRERWRDERNKTKGKEKVSRRDGMGWDGMGWNR